MVHKSSVWVIFSLVLASSQAQVSSHAPTVFKQPPAQKIAAPSVQSNSAKAVARVNGSILTDADLLREEYTIFPYAQQHNGAIPNELAPQIRNGALKMIIFEELVYQEALHRKMTVPAAKFQRAQADFRKQFATPDEFNALVQNEFHGAQQLLDEKIRRSLLIDAYLQAEVESKSTVTAAEAKAYYDQNPSRFERPEMYRFQSISLLPPSNATATQLKEVHTRAENALKQARATKSVSEFGLLAEKVSEDDYRVMMGQHKPVPVSEIPPQVVKTLAAMKIGDVSDIIPVEQAFTILRVQEHMPAGKTKFEETKAQLVKEMQDKKRNQFRAALDKKLRETAKVEEM